MSGTPGSNNPRPRTPDETRSEAGDASTAPPNGATAERPTTGARGHGEDTRSTTRSGRHGTRDARAATRARVAAQREAEHRAQRRRRIVHIGGAVVAALAVAGGLTVAVTTSGSSSTSSAVSDGVRPASDATSPIPGARVYDARTRDHVSGTPITYSVSPPVGGRHDPVWLNCGIYSQPVANRNAVHALEHGAVWITYRPGLPADQLATLRSKVEGRTYLVLSPYPNLPSPITVSAWGVQLSLDDPGDARLDQFVATYREGPQTPEPGAPCSGGVGRPA